MGERPVVLQIWTTADFLQFTRPLVLRLSSEGYDVHVISSPGSALEELSRQGIEVHPLPMSRGFDVQADSEALPRLIALLRRIRPHVVHAHTPKAGLLGMMAAAAVHVPIRIYQLHGLRYESSVGTKRAILMGAERTTVRLAHRILCVSHSVRERGITDGIFGRSIPDVIGGGSAAGIAPSEYDAGSLRTEVMHLRRQLDLHADDRCVVYAGRLARDKGLLDLEQAWSIVTRANPQARLLLAGENDPTDAVELNALRGRADVRILGQVQDARPLIGLADVVTLPSYREGLPQGILEAGLLEKPVVVTRVTGNIDAVREGKTGLFVPPRDPPSLANALVRLLADPDLRVRLGRAAREFVSVKFERERVLSAYAEYYARLFD